MINQVLALAKIYQRHEQARTNCTVVSMKTGQGKTFCIIMLIMKLRMMKDSEPDQRFTIVTTTSYLVKQF